jgi:hypothetical protein
MQVSATADRWGAKGAPFELRLACIETWITARIDEAAAGTRQSSELRNSAHLSESSSDMNIAWLLRVLEGSVRIAATAAHIDQPSARAGAVALAAAAGVSWVEGSLS